MPDSGRFGGFPSMTISRSFSIGYSRFWPRSGIPIGCAVMRRVALLRRSRRAFERVIVTKHQHDAHGDDPERREQQQPARVAAGVVLDPAHRKWSRETRE